MLAWQTAESGLTLPVERGLPGGARALLPHKCYAALLSAMAPHRPRPAALFVALPQRLPRLSSILALAAARDAASLAARATTSPLDEEAPGVGAGPLPVTAAAGGVPARGIPPLDATAGAYVTSIDTFYVQY